MFRNRTPEQRAAMAKKSADTRRRNYAAKRLETKLAADVRKLTKADDEGLETKLAAEAKDEGFPEPEVVYGEVPDEPADEPVAGPSTPFDLFLLGLGREIRDILTVDELRVIYAEQVASALAEKKAAKKKEAKDLALQSARMEAGLVPRATRDEIEWQKRQNELMRMTIELPPSGEQGEIPDIGLRVDQKIYLHGHTYTFTRAQFDSYREMLYRVSEHELQFKGQNRRQRQWLMGRALGTVNTHVNLNPDGSLA